MSPWVVTGLLWSIAQAGPSHRATDLSDLATSLTRQTREHYAADLAEVKRRRVLRVLTRNNSTTYFIARGAQRGFQYELVQAFADELGVRLSMVVPPGRDQLITALLEGRGDLIAAGMTKTPVRAEKVRFTRPVYSDQRVVVTHLHTIKPLETFEDLLGFEVHASLRSTTFRDLQRVEGVLGRPLRILDVVDDVEMEQMLHRVSEGVYEATVADERLVELAIAGGDRVVPHLELGKPRQKAWAVHPGALELQRMADDFLQRMHRRGRIRALNARYLRSGSRLARWAREFEYRADQQGKLSAFDDVFRRAGAVTGIDWRLLAAVAFSESRFDPTSKSRFGAVGLMQVLPSTAERLGVKTRLAVPHVNVLTGARYLRRLVRVFAEDGVDQDQQIRFALAAYNAGLGHIFDARRLAVQTGRDPNRWFGHVEEALKLKMDPKFHERTRYGYCRATETIKYVRRIQSRYDVYVQHLPLPTVVAATP